MGQSKDTRKTCGEVVSGSRWKGFELDVPNFNITRVKKSADVLMRGGKLRQLMSQKESNVPAKMR